MNRARMEQGRGPLDLIEEAVHLLRLAPASAFLSYYAGSLPFVLGLLFFWTDMSRGSFARDRLPVAALGTALLFLWMKVWQAVFARQMLARLGGVQPARLGWGGAWRVVATQAALQPAGLFVLPMALVLLIPFGWAFAFFQNLSAIGGGDSDSVRRAASRAWRQACLWPRQNHAALLILHLFSLFVLLNLAAGLALLPHLLKSLLGIETVFSRTWMAVFNTTFLAVVAGLAYLCLDPLIKTFYVLRCFEGESLTTGQDLKAGLRSLAGRSALPGAALILALAVAPLDGAQAQPASHGHSGAVAMAGESGPGLARGSAGAAGAGAGCSADDLDRAIREVMGRRDYNWRLPREKSDPGRAGQGAVAGFMRSLMETAWDSIQTAGRWIEKTLRWIFGDRLRQPAPKAGSLEWLNGLQWFMVALVIALACVLAVMLLRLWRRREARPEASPAAPVQPVPDLADEAVGADQLPEDEWSRLARDLAAQGQFRLALRALYLCSLAHLAARDLVRLARFKSNREYERELSRRAHALPNLSRAFAENVAVFDRSWYGLHEVSREMAEHFAANVTRMKEEA